MQEKKVSKVGWLPVEEKIGESFRDLMLGTNLNYLVTTKKDAVFLSKTGEARKVKVTLSLTVEDV